MNVLGDPDIPLADQPNQKALQNVYALYTGNGMGADLASANGTAWGLVNSVTQFVDHMSISWARSQDHRLDSAWFGPGASIKAKAYQESYEASPVGGNQTAWRRYAVKKLKMS